MATIDHYLWLDNDYRPRVEIRACYSRRYIYLSFKVFESRIRARFTRFQDPVYKDSCVELFINPFPEKASAFFIKSFAISSLSRQAVHIELKEPFATWNVSVE